MNEEIKKEQTSEIVDQGAEVQESLEIEKKKKNPLIFIIPGIILIFIIGFFVVRTFGQKGEQQKVVQEEEIVQEDLVPLDASVEVNLVKSTAKDNSVVITVTGMASRFVSIGYELQYESGGVGKGVTSGSKPLDVTGQDEFEREIYLGTCSKNVCKPDLGVSSVTLVLEFTSTAGTKSQFSEEFEL